MPLYGAEPPVADTVTVVVPPGMVITPAVAETDTGVGLATFAVVVAAHPLASVIV